MTESNKPSKIVIGWDDVSAPQSTAASKIRIGMEDVVEAAAQRSSPGTSPWSDAVGQGTGDDRIVITPESLAGAPRPAARAPSRQAIPILGGIQDLICGWCGLQPLTGFAASEFFLQTTAPRAQKDVDAYFNCGCKRTTPTIAEVDTSWPRPWFFWRILLFGLLTTLGFGLGVEYFQNWRMVPGLIITGAFFVPLACVALFFEVNILRNISLYQVVKFVVCGGIVSLLVALFLFTFTSSLGQIMGDTIAGPVEEPAKLLAAILLLCSTQKYKWVLNALLVGAAVGAGFAGFETAGYIYGGLIHALQTQDATPFYETMIKRAVYAPFGHVVWTASLAGALWRVKKDRPFQVSMLFEWDFVRILGFVVMLHMLWNFDLWRFIPASGGMLKVHLFFWVLSFAGSWYLVLLLVQEGLRQVETAKIAGAAGADASYRERQSEYPA